MLYSVLKDQDSNCLRLSSVQEKLDKRVEPLLTAGAQVSGKSILNKEEDELEDEGSTSDSYQFALILWVQFIYIIYKLCCHIYKMRGMCFPNFRAGIEVRFKAVIEFQKSHIYTHYWLNQNQNSWFQDLVFPTTYVFALKSLTIF